MSTGTQYVGHHSSKHARYHCMICHRPFDRKDVLSRHMHLHDAHRPPPTTRRKACQCCAKSKTRCSGERPKCSSCARRNLVCSFEDAAGTMHQNTNQPSSTSAEQDSPAPAQRLPQSSSLSYEGSVVTPPASEVQSTEPILDQNGFDFYPSKAGLAATVDHGTNELGSLSSDLIFMPFDNLGLNTSFDWMFESSGSEYHQPNSSLDIGDGNENSPSQLLQISAPQTSPRTATVTVGSDDLGDGASLRGLLIPQPQDKSGHGDPWPLESPRPPLKHIILPRLEFHQPESSQSRGRFFDLMPMTDMTWDALQRCLRLPFEDNTLQTLDLEHFPSKDELDQCIDLYFAYFQPMLSVIHQPTFDPGKNLMVTIAIICIGVCYTQLHGSQTFSIVLSELNRRLLVFMAEHDHRFVRTQSYLVAQLLQGTHGYSSGSERLFELSESSRYNLIYHAKCMGLFRSESMNHVPLGATVKESWQGYICAESSRRLAWAVFQYDISAAYLHNTRPFLSFADLNLNLPGSKEHWESESAEVWASLHPWSQRAPPVSPLQTKLALFFDGSPNPTDTLSEEHLFIIVLILLGMILVEKQTRSSPLENPATPLGYENRQQMLVHMIDQTKVPILAMIGTHTQSEIERLVHRTQLVHIAHIYGAGDLMNWLFPYLRDDDAEKDIIKIRMSRWANENPRRMRETIYHSAQILSLVRHYPSQMPLQSFLIFHAGVVLSCMSSLLPESCTSLRVPSIQLEKLAADETAKQMRWVEEGGESILSLTGVPSLCCPTGRQKILDQTALLLKRHKTWGISNILVKIVISLQKRDI